MSLAGVGAVGEPVGDRQQGVHLPQSPEERRTRTGNVLHANRGRCHLAGAHERRETAEPVVRDRGHADVGLVRHGGIRGDLRARLREGVEESRLPGVGQTDDADLESHGGVG